MKRLFLLISMLFLATVSFAKETTFNHYSYTEFFNLIAHDKDSVFRLDNAIIKYNAKTDSLFRYSFTFSGSAFEMVIHPVRKDTINIYKQIILNNVQFLNEAGDKRSGAGLCLIHFHKKVTIKNTLEMTVDECVFDSLVQNSNDKTLVSPTEIDSSGNYRANSFSSCIFKKGIDCSSLGSDEKAILAQETYDHCIFYPINNYGLNNSFWFTHSEFLTI